MSGPWQTASLWDNRSWWHVPWISKSVTTISQCSLLCWSDLQIWHSHPKCSHVRTCWLTPVIQMNICGRRKRHLTLPEITSLQAPPLQESLCLLKHRFSFLFLCYMCHGPCTPESPLCPSLRKSMVYRRALCPECWIATSCHWVWAAASNLGVTAGRAGDLWCHLCCASSSSKMQDTKSPSCAWFLPVHPAGSAPGWLHFHDVSWIGNWMQPYYSPSGIF